MPHEDKPLYETADRRFASDPVRQASYRRFLTEREEQIKRRVGLLRAYIEITPARPKEVAEIAAELASYELNIDPPAVRQMTAEEIRKSPNKMGYALPSSNTISIRMNGSDCACKVACVTAHETKHRQQMIEGRFMAMLGRGESEPDAEKFQKEFTKEFLAGVRCECRTRPVSFSHLLNR
jgi:hypothetical protein